MVKPIPPLNVSDTWPKANYVNPEIRSHGTLLAITIVFTTVMVLIISMRLYVRLFMLRTPGWDDFFILIAAVRTFRRRDRKKTILTVTGIFYWLVCNDEHVYERRMGYVSHTHCGQLLTILKIGTFGIKSLNGFNSQSWYVYLYMSTVRTRSSSV